MRPVYWLLLTLIVLALLALLPGNTKWLLIVKRIAMAGTGFLCAYLFLRLNIWWSVAFGILCQFPGYTWPSQSRVKPDAKA